MKSRLSLHSCGTEIEEVPQKWILNFSTSISVLHNERPRPYKRGTEEVEDQRVTGWQRSRPNRLPQWADPAFCTRSPPQCRRHTPWHQVSSTHPMAPGLLHTPPGTSLHRNALFPLQSIISVAIDHSRCNRSFPSQRVIPLSQEIITVAMHSARHNGLFPSQLIIPVAINYSRRNWLFPSH